MRSIPVIAMAAVFLLVDQTANAEVVDSASNGFTIRSSVEVAADREHVYNAMMSEVSEWWNGDHTMSGYASNLYIESSVPGCFCEHLPNGGGVVHMLVTFVNPGIIVRMTGGLGPLGLRGVSGNMIWEFSDSADGTAVKLSYQVGGYMDEGVDSMADAVDYVLQEQLKGLKAHAEQSAGEQ